MKIKFLVSCLLAALLCAGSAQAQSQPPARDYSKVVSDIALTCPAAFQKAANGRAVFKNAPVSDAFRRQVIPYIVGELNKLDPGKWGVLYRTDRQDETPEPGRLTTDVVIWIPGRLHYDVMSDQNTSWGIIGPLPNDKDWFIKSPSDFPTICGTVQPPPPPPVDPPVPPVDLSAILSRLSALEAENSSLRDAINGLRASVNNSHDSISLLDAGLTEAQGRLLVIESKPFPAFPALSCSGRGPFGIPISCSVTPVE